ncbi:M28 family peptidase [Cyclobacteriaceae bacterium]|nr:M28 family peptidase [Cyclobacteriaceae bacterium]
MRFLTVLFLIVSTNGFCQDLDFYKQQVDTLCSPYFFGRGYLKEGHKKSAEYLKSSYEQIGYEVTLQSFPMKANVFPAAKDIVLDDSHRLVLGQDFIPASYSNGISGSFPIYTVDSVFLTKQKEIDAFVGEKFRSVVAYDKTYLKKHKEEFSKEVIDKMASSYAVIELTNGPLTGSVAPFTSNAVVLECLLSKWKRSAREIKLNIEAETRQLESYNVVAVPKDFSKKKKTIIVTGHFDHLGGYGDKVFVSGANDNASGVAMMLDLAKSLNNDQVNYVFIAFGGEEAGLIGSKYYVEHPLINLKKTDLVVNLDLMGAGSKGLTIENGVELKDVADAFKIVNDQYFYLPKIKTRKNAPNSDHFPFTEKKVSAVFLYSLGDVGGYHNVLDDKKDLEYGSYVGLFSLVKAVLESEQLYKTL